MILNRAKRLLGEKCISHFVKVNVTGKDEALSNALVCNNKYTKGDLPNGL